MAHKKAKIKNDPKELGVDTIIKDKEGVIEDWSAKTVEAESDTKLDADIGTGQVLTLRHFFFKPNQEKFKKRVPSAQELFDSHVKQMEVEFWKDEWIPAHDVPPRLIFYDKFKRPVSHTSKKIEWYSFIIAAMPAKGSLLSQKDQEQVKTLTQIANEARIA